MAYGHNPIRRVATSLVSGERIASKNIPGKFDLATPRHQLEYVAALSLQLSAMTEQMGLETLNGLLRLAHHEASVQIDRIATATPHS